MGLLSRLRPAPAAYDLARERDAEARARALMRSIVSEEEFAMYEELGFVSVAGGGEGYSYLLYPHRPIVAYETATGEPLSEYCVRFRDHGDPAVGERLPDADDVLARWMSLRGGERELLASANLNAPGRQHDPSRIRRDLDALRAWRAASGGG